MYGCFGFSAAFLKTYVLLFDALAGVALPTVTLHRSTTARAGADFVVVNWRSARSRLLVFVHVRVFWVLSSFSQNLCFVIRCPCRCSVADSHITSLNHR